MKKSLLAKTVFGAFFMMLFTGLSAQQFPEYQVELRNASQPASNIFEFDIHIRNTSSSIIYEYNTAQFGIFFNPLARNGGSIFAEFVAGSSELCPAVAPNTIIYHSGSNMVRISGQPPAENCFIPLAPDPGLTIIRVRLTNSVPFAEDTPPNLTFSFSSPYSTQLAAYIGDPKLNYLVTNSSYFFNMTGNLPLNSTCDDYLFSNDSIVCENELPFLWQGLSITTGGTYTQTYPTTDPPGCDSTYILNLTVNPTYEFVVYDTIFDNQLPYIWRDNLYWSGGTYEDTYQTLLGCDSIYILHLHINPSGTLWVNREMGTAAQANWSPIPGAVKYEVRYSDLGGGSVYSPVPQTTMLWRKLPYLEPNTDYLLELRYHDGNVWSSYNTAYPSVVFNSGECKVWVTHDIGTKATIHWTNLDYASSYILQFKTGTNDWMIKGTFTTNEENMYFTENTPYEFRVIPRFNNAGFWQSEALVYTSNYISFVINYDGGNTANFSWDTVSPNATSHILQLREQGTTSWQNFTSTTNSRFVTGLTPGAHYEYRLVVRYGGVSWGATSIRPLTSGTKEIAIEEFKPFSHYPNPVSDVLTVEIFSDKESTFNWKLYDLNGKLIQSGMEAIYPGTNSVLVEMSHIPTGLYLLKSEIEGEIRTSKIVRQ
jgi:hypothetical protein